MPELRKDPVTGRWVIISTERQKRPSDFRLETFSAHPGAACPFCAGNEDKTPPEVLAYRNGTPPNTPGWDVRVVPNKFPALQIEGTLDRQGEGMFDRMNGIGAHEVIIETPDHQQTLARLPERPSSGSCGRIASGCSTSSRIGGSATSSCSRTTARRPARRSITRTRS